MANFIEAIGHTRNLIGQLRQSWQDFDNGYISRNEQRNLDYQILDGLAIQIEHHQNNARAVLKTDSNNLKKDPRKKNG